ncbi:MAG: ABC transporter ATP-binding protein, partial [Gammaproteobacteria bacterium]|nr:ABC transporter ATP-binding protein [Gammaproteobacteria bacterium]
MLLLDEPFSALDAPTRARLLEDFQALLVETGITTLFVTHDLDEALFLGDRVAVLLEGRLRQSGPPQEVFSAPADRDVAAFVGVETVLTGQVVAARNGGVSVDASGALFEAVG